MALKIATYDLKNCNILLSLFFNAGPKMSESQIRIQNTVTTQKRPVYSVLRAKVIPKSNAFCTKC